MPTLISQATHSPFRRFAVSPFFWSEAGIRCDLIPVYGPLRRLPLCSSRATSSHSIDEVVPTPQKPQRPLFSYAVLPVQGEVREEFSPLLYPLFANYVASYLAARLGRSLFQSDRPELLQSREIPVIQERP